MNNGNRRRNRKRYRVRYDRVIAVALVLLVLIVLITSCSKGCSDKGKDKNKNSSSQSDIINNISGGEQPVVTDPNGSVVPDATNNATPGAVAYTTQNIEYTDINKGDLVLVNSLHDYKFLEGDVNLTTVYESRNSYYGVSDMVLSLDSNTVTQLNAMMEGFAMATSNQDIRVIGGYRSLEAQTDKYNSGKSKFQGGFTDYHTARTFDIGVFPSGQSSNYYKPEGIYAWINDNASNYGFIVRFPEGKETLTGEDSRAYTFRYVGIPHATYMKQNNLCLEEYIETIKTYTSNNPLKVTCGTAQYDVFYVTANVNNTTGVPVPSTLPYTVSGNNVDGFIVTVTTAQ